MIIYAIKGDFYSIKEETFDGIDTTYCPEVVEQSKFDTARITHMAEFIIEHNNGVFTFIKNLYEYEEIIMFSFKDVFQYINDVSRRHEYTSRKVYNLTPSQFKALNF